MKNKNFSLNETEYSYKKIKESAYCLLIIDVQEILIKSIPEHKKLIWNIERLIDASNLLNSKIISTEQNPDKLGNTVKRIKSKLTRNSYSKMGFSCCCNPNLKKELEESQRKDIIICGVESHICVLQTAIDLIDFNYNVHIIIDAVGSRNIIDQTTAIKRLESVGAIISTTETAIFELCKTSERKEFREISKIIKRSFELEKVE